MRNLTAEAQFSIEQHNGRYEVIHRTGAIMSFHVSEQAARNYLRWLALRWRPVA